VADRLPMAPDVTLSLERLLCPPHGEHLREAWPKGLATIGVRLFTAALESNAEGSLFRAVMELHPDAERPEARWIDEITQHRPLCYFVPSHVLLEALLDCGVGQVVNCASCQVPRMGGAYNVRLDGSPEPRKVKLCFVCAVGTGQALHAAKPEGDVW
jgi:hypothetical protein